MSRYLISNLLGLVGAALGGVAGFYAYNWILTQGLVGLMIPGAFLGLGCSLLARHPSILRGIVCGIAGLFLSLFTHWYNAPTDASFLEFLKGAKDLLPITLLMAGLGTFIAFWLGKDAGLARRSRPAAAPMGETAPQQTTPQQEGKAG
jgi:hypothetical protein